MKPTLPLRPALLLAVLLFASGCASMREYSCERQEESTRGTKPHTTYRLIQPRPGQPAARTLSAGSVAMVPAYDMSFRPGYTRPCTTLTLHKDVTIQRSADQDVVLSEIREFYAEDGTLITSATQDVSSQIRQSGTYVATTPLPIPKSAPPGKYRIVSRLLYERRGGRNSHQIARAEGFFYIIPPR